MNRFALILSMKYCVNISTNSFERYGKEKLNIFLRKTWKEIKSVLSFNSKNVEPILKEKNMLIHLQIYKANILPDTESVSRYAALWEQSICMFQNKKIQKKNNERDKKYLNVTKVENIKNYEITKRHFF